MSAVLNGAFKATQPAYAITVNQQGKAPPPVDDTIGGAGVVLEPNEKIEPLINSLAQSADGKALLEFISVMLGEMMPPVIAGRGQASSGADRFMAQQQAAALHVDPLINAMEDNLGYIHTLMFEGLYRKLTGKKAWLKGVPVRQRSRKAGDDTKGASAIMLTAADLERVGCTVTVKFKRFSISERMQLGAMLKNMVDAKFMSRMTAMDELDVEDYERENARMLVEALYEDPDMVKSSIDAMLEEQIDPPRLTPNQRGQRRLVRLHRAWLKRQQAQLQPRGSAPAPLGQVAPPGMPEQPPLPGLPAAGVAQ
jgi:hypothetical protein